jgi:hypothetical protein
MSERLSVAGGIGLLDGTNARSPCVTGPALRDPNRCVEDGQLSPLAERVDPGKAIKDLPSAPQPTE